MKAGAHRPRSNYRSDQGCDVVVLNELRILIQIAHDKQRLDLRRGNINSTTQYISRPTHTIYI